MILGVNNSIGLYQNNLLNRVSNPVSAPRTGVMFKGLENDVFQPSVKTNTVQNLSNSEKIAIEFGKDLTSLVEAKNATADEIQNLIKKHLGVDNVKIRSMSEYRQPNRPGISMIKAAVTRPNFDQNGNLIDIEVFIPDVDYNNKNDVLKFVDKTVHEITHVVQYTKNYQSSAHHAPTSVGRFMNFIQKRITDRLTDKGVTDSAVAFVREANCQLQTTEDYDKFMDTVTDKVTTEKLGEILKFGKDSEAQRQNINAVFDLLFEETLKGMQYEKDPNALATIQIYGGMDGFKAKIKSICAKSLKDEQEAYNAGNLMRKDLNGVSCKQTYNDLIHMLMGMYSEALA